MDGFEQIDIETVVDLLKRYGGLLVAILIALIAKSRKSEAPGVDEEYEVEESKVTESSDYKPIHPGTDATKLSSKYSQSA